MKKAFLKFLRFGLSIDAYCARVGGNKAMLVDSIQRIAEIDRELDFMEIQP